MSSPNNEIRRYFNTRLRAKETLQLLQKLNDKMSVYKSVYVRVYEPGNFVELEVHYLTDREKVEALLGFGEDKRPEQAGQVIEYYTESGLKRFQAGWGRYAKVS